ncbi:MAG: glycosyl transferase [Spirochaetales bacterium]|nr:glycosyl transferase [Spirochaetales bacterium]
MKFGYFDHEKKEYVITTPKTPVKWINYIGTLKFGGFIDHNGGGVICKQDPAENRIVKYIPQLPASDMNGETCYIRYKENNEYHSFSPYYTPTLDKYDFYECRVGLGYSLFTSEFYGIRTEITVFVPLKSTQVIRKIKIKNTSQKSREIDVIPVVEYTHFQAMKQFNNADWVPQTQLSRLVNSKNGSKILKQCAFMNLGRAENFFTSNFPISSFESDRARFLGNQGYGSWAVPGALQQKELGNTEVNRGDNIGALMHHLGILNPGDEKTIITQLGQVTSIEKAIHLIEKYKDEAQVDQAFNVLQNFWKNYLDTIQVQTPDENMNAMINVHNARQCYITKNWSRYLSLYQLGLGARGMGFRDSSQDVMGILAGAPEEAEALIVKLLRVQKRNGSAMHQFNPLSMIANEGDSREEEDRPNYYGDDHLWIIFAVCAYVKETGDFEFLNREIPFYEKDKNEKPLESASVLEHLKRGIQFTHNNVGKHGLPLLGFADWNDTVNLWTGAESVFVAHQYGYALKELMEIVSYLGDDETFALYKTYYSEMKMLVNQYAWDGEWFTRYFDFDGTPIGSHKNEKGKIFTNAQSWAVISGFAQGEKAQQALDSVRKHLNTKNGIKLSWPGYNKYSKSIGGISTYLPGTKENGGIFLHTNPWVMIAETILGRGDYAFEYYNQINPAAKNDIIDEYEVEPYCYAQNILGDEHPQFGLGRNSWLSGTASWCFQAATKFILGIRPECDGLKIDPCIPKNWKGFSIKRKFRGAFYNIEVKNPQGINKGVEKLLLDGKEVPAQILPVPEAGKSYTVEVIMGIK